MTDIAARFARDIADHRMTVLHDDGLYRHLRFRREANGFYWFDLITVPGVLIFRGDGESFVFSRITDMFEFFRDSGAGQRINPDYWAEKLTSCDSRVMRHDEELFKARVEEAVADATEGGALPGLAEAVRDEVLEAEDIAFEDVARRALNDFEFYVNEDDRYALGKRPDFRFEDAWEWDFRDYDWWFLWACHAIVWGIASYDAGRALPVAEQPAETAPQPSPAPVRGRVETVHAAGGVL